MKTVSGEVISSKSISLKKAAKTLSRFASSDNGASPAFAVYLRRASASFDELVQLHKETKLPGSAHKDKKRRSKDVSEGTFESAISSGDKGKEIDVNKRKESRGVNKGEGEDGRGIVRTVERKVEGIVDVNVSKNETESFDGSKDTRKKKRDKLGTEKHDIAVDIERKRESFLNNENAGNDQAIDTGKKHGSKQKKNREQSYSDHAPIVTNDEIESIDQSKEIKKKKKNKKQNDDDKQSIETVNNGGNNKYGQPSGTRDAYVADVNTETDSVDDSKKPRKKKKRDNHDNINSGEVIYKDKEMQGDPSTKDVLNNETAQVVKNAVDDQKKRKKNKNKNEMKGERFDGDINSDERRYESNKVPGNVENVDKKKETYEGKERKKEGKLENEGANNNESRKWKHESVAAGESNDSQEHHKLKKKKR